MEAGDLLKINNCVAGVTAIDQKTKQSLEYRARVVINAAGPWCRKIAKRFDCDKAKLFRGSLAWNVLLGRKPLSNYAVAVAPIRAGGQTYFLLPWKGKLLAGTGHVPWFNSTENPMPTEEQMQEFLNDLNLAIPGLELHQGDIVHIFAGLLPVTKDGSVDLVSREVIVDHAEQGGPKGLYSVSGVKYTTSRLVAEKTLKRTFKGKSNLGNNYSRKKLK
jgi:glycerol-3-phosphate dehydrogenase